MKFEEVNLYKAAHKIILECSKIQSKMNKSFKYTLGSDLCNNALDISKYLFIAYEEQENREEKIRNIKIIRQTLQQVLILIRIAHDLNLIKHEDYVSVMPFIENSFLQTKKWINKA